MAFLLLFMLQGRAQIAVQLHLVNVLNSDCLENPITVVVSDVPDSNLLLLPSIGSIRKEGSGIGCFSWYICTGKPGEATLIVRDTVEQIDLDTFSYRLQPLPEAKPLLGALYKSMEIERGAFRAQVGCMLAIPGECSNFWPELLEYEVMVIWKDKRPVFIQTNQGKRFNAEIARVLQQVVPGDRVIFRKFAYRPVGMAMLRYSADELVFKIK